MEEVKKTKNYVDRIVLTNPNDIVIKMPLMDMQDGFKDKLKKVNEQKLAEERIKFIREQNYNYGFEIIKAGDKSLLGKRVSLKLRFFDAMQREGLDYLPDDCDFGIAILKPEYILWELIGDYAPPIAISKEATDSKGKKILN